MRPLKCACRAPAVVAVVVLVPPGPRRFGFCAQHLHDLLAHPDVLTRLTGQAEIVTTFSERRLRQLIEPPP